MEDKIFEIYSLEYCPYSIDVEKKFKKLKNKKIIKVYQNNKQEIKIKNNMNTFPQIFYNYKKNRYKIGGLDNLNDILNIFNTNSKFKKIYTKIKKYLKINKKKIILQIIDNLKDL